MQNYHTELRIRRSYLAMEHPADFDAAKQEDIATKAVLREYIDNLAMEDAFLASLPPRPTETEATR